jgi:D-beta-D-heptose 7-phosphate kinase/D-beta-D-heptose 1-phosphate adenosyltransferase
VEQDEPVILCSGCFDGLHAGHVAYLEAAAALRFGDERLMVAVACDDYIRRVKHREPSFDLSMRMRTVAGLRAVDDVGDHGPAGAAYVIRAVRPRLFVKGQDWKLNGLAPDVIDACIDVGCRVLYVNTEIGRHTSDAVSAHQ